MSTNDNEISENTSHIKDNSLPLNDNVQDNSSHMEDRKTELVNKLRQRNEARLLKAENRRSERNANKEEHETAERFLETFGNLRVELENELGDIDKVDDVKRAVALERISEKLNDLQKYLTDSISYLPSYSVRSSQESLVKLRSLVQAKREAVLPKKKFVFKGTSTKSSGDPSASAVPPKPANPNPSISAKKTAVQSSKEPAFGFSGRCGEDLCLEEADLKGRSLVTLDHLVDCTVRLRGPLQSLQLDELKGCRIYSGPVGGSIFMDHCTDCKISVACQQLRVHNSHDVTLYMHVTSRCIIEDCDGILTAPYNLESDRLDEYFTAARLDRARNNWNVIDDFNALLGTSTTPNWSILAEDKRCGTVKL